MDHELIWPWMATLRSRDKSTPLVQFLHQTLSSRSPHLGAAEQGQQALELAPVMGGGVELEGKSASIKSISDSIQASNALSFFSCSVSFLSCSISLLSRLRSICRSIPFSSSSLSRISLSGSRRQLSIDKNEWKRDSDEPDAPLLLEEYDVAEEVDVVIGGEQRNESNHKASDSLQHGWRIDRETTRPDLQRGRELQSRSPNQQPPKLVLVY